MTDFTLIAYQKLIIALKNAGYGFYTFEDWCDGKAKGKYVILRHDIDKKPKNALAFAKLEFELGISATYYFRTSKKILQPNTIKGIASLGHEIGYHYRDLVDKSGNTAKAIESFEANLTELRSVADVRTISMDGCPWSKYDNRDLWKSYDYRDFGIVGEPYFDLLNSKQNDENKVHYFTDTARMWNGDKYNVRDKAGLSNSFDIGDRSKVIHSTFDFIDWLKTNPYENLMITTHPQRWTDNKLEWVQELIMQSLKNKFKQLLIRFR